MMIPPEPEIATVMRETGMGRMQAINHLRQRRILQRREGGHFGRPALRADVRRNIEFHVG